MTRTPEQREAARNLAEKIQDNPFEVVGESVGVGHGRWSPLERTLSRALLDAEAEVAAMAEWAAKVPHALNCASFVCRTCHQHREDIAQYCVCPATGTHPTLRGKCNCHLSTISADLIARGRELLEPCACCRERGCVDGCRCETESR